MNDMEYEINRSKGLWLPKVTKDREFFNKHYSFALPLLVENPDYPEFPYHFIGSCFLITRNGKQYVVTAKHCLEDTNTNPNNLFVLRHLKSRDCIGLCHSYSPKQINYEGQALIDKNQLDFIIFEVEKHEFKDVYPIPFDNAGMHIHRPGTSVFNLSYPFKYNTIDYEIDKIKLRQRYYLGEYTKKEDDFTHRIKLDIQGDVLSGASGSPLMVGTPERFKITGILTRADEINLTGEAAYLDAVLIALAIDQHDPANNTLK